MSEIKTPVEQLRDFEQSYYSSRPEAVLEAIEQRDAGWPAASEQGGRVVNLGLLAESCETLAEVPEKFNRERFASLARYAQALCADGQFDQARGQALAAVEVTPKPLERTRPISVLFGGYDFRTSEFPDQYEVIFVGRLSLALAASTREGDLHTARSLAERARRLARISEDPNRVAFPAGPEDMDEERRRETRSEFGKVAWVATGAIWMPLTAPEAVSSRFKYPLSRQDVAQRVCAA